MKFIIIETTTNNLSIAKKLAKILLKEKLTTCVQFSKIKTSYIWEEKIKNDNEILITIKTKRDFYHKIEEIILKNHNYKIPEIIAKEITQGSSSYLEWIKANLK